VPSGDHVVTAKDPAVGLEFTQILVRKITFTGSTEVSGSCCVRPPSIQKCSMGLAATHHDHLSRRDLDRAVEGVSPPNAAAAVRPDFGEPHPRASSIVDVFAENSRRRLAC
jgi:hypothetical protein